MSSTNPTNFPLGLPNIGASCWLNAALQLFFYSSQLLQVIREGNRNKESTPMHFYLSQMLESLQSRKQPYEIVSVYRELHQYIISVHPSFASNALNDTHEVITFVVNQLHQESGQKLPGHIRERIVDPVSSVILRDFDNRLSKILECCMGVTSRKCKDESVIYETFTTLFVDPFDEEKNNNDLQLALNKLQFHSVPKSLFISLILQPTQQSCMLLDNLHVGGGTFVIRGIVFFLPNMYHYIVAVRGTLDDVSGWCIFNDANVSFMKPEELCQIPGIPTLILYEQIGV